MIDNRMAAGVFRHRSAWFLLAVLLLTSIGRAEVTGVLARGQGDQFWLLRTETEKDKPTYTAVRRLADPVSGNWVESYRLGGEFVDAAPVAERLAVLAADGSWRLVWDGGSVGGPAAPDGHTLRRIASDGKVLWAVAQPKDQPGELLKWTESDGWSIVAKLPDDAELPNVSLGVFAGTPWLVCGPENAARVFRHTANAQMPWQPVGGPLANPPAHPHAWVSNSSRPLLHVRVNDGHALVPVDDKREPTSFRAAGVASVAAVGPTVRVVSIEGGKVVQTVVDNFGRGKSFGPDVIPDPAPKQPDRMEWINLVLLMALTVAMMRSLRSDPVEQPPIAAGLQLARPWRRALAAIIDASPAIAVAAYVVVTFEGSAEELKLTPTNFYLPVYLSLFVYIAHVTVTEIMLGTSVGKWLLRLRVVSIDGTRVPAGRIVLRNLLRVVEIALFLPMFLPLITPTGQRVGDMAAKTLVVTRDGVGRPKESPGDDRPPAA